MIKLHCTERTDKENGTAIVMLMATCDNVGVTVAGNLVINTTSDTTLMPGSDYDLNFNKVQ